MEPRVDRTGFGWIEVAGSRYNYDIVITMGGAVRKRRKKLSKEVYGTSHTISIAEARDVYEQGCRTLIIGSGKFGRVQLSPEAQSFFAEHSVVVALLPTQDAVERWNAIHGAVAGLFHVTC